MKNISINSAEAIITNFFDQDSLDFDKWTLKCPPNSEARKIKNWDCCKIEFNNKKSRGEVYKFYNKKLNINCFGYDNIRFFSSFPLNTIVTTKVVTDYGVLVKEHRPFMGASCELYLELNGAKIIKEIIISIKVRDLGISNCNIKWIMLQNKKALEYHLNQFRGYDAKWKGYLKDERYKPTFVPTYNLVVNKEELELIRSKYRKNKFQGIETESLEELAKKNPEDYISDYVNFWDDTRFERERDFRNQLNFTGVKLAEAGILLKNAKFLRVAARYALSMMFCENFYDSFMCNTRGCKWEHRGFVPSIIAFEVGQILDLCGEFFTEKAIEYILRRLAEDCLGTINFAVWKHDYMFHNNQLAWFTNGRLLAYSILEHHYKHIHKYTDLAYEETLENFNNIIMKDGGYGEGPSYFSCFGGHAMTGLYFYARNRGLRLEEIIPQTIKNTDSYVQAIHSTTDTEVLPLCDGHPEFNMETVAFMANLCKGSFWEHLLLKRLEAKPKFESLIIENLLLKAKGSYSEVKSFIAMPNLGVVASHRYLMGNMLKVFVMGNKALIDHAHEDKGSFIVEYEGLTYLMDSGITNYSFTLCATLQLAQSHNMLIPYNTNDIPHPDRPNKVDIIVKGSGDKNTFTSTVDLEADWKGYYKKWNRVVKADTLDTITVIDTYLLEKGTGVIFNLNTLLEVKSTDKEVIIIGKDHKLVISIPAECQVLTEEVNYIYPKTQHRIKFIKLGTEGVIKVEMKFV